MMRDADEPKICILNRTQDESIVRRVKKLKRYNVDPEHPALALWDGKFREIIVPACHEEPEQCASISTL